jgi:hypothetical protein
MENIATEEKIKASEKEQEIWTFHERELLKSRYGCEILKHNCTLEEVQDTDVPKDAYIVTYLVSGKVCYDLTRSGKKVSVFDMYYDSMGDAIRTIEWGCGKINPKFWGYEPPKNKKRK